MKLIREAFKSLDSIALLFANQLSFDLSDRIGLISSKKTQAYRLLQQGGIDQSIYDKLLRLELDELEDAQENDSEEESEIDFGISGIAMDPCKKNLGIKTAGSHSRRRHQNYNNSDDSDEDENEYGSDEDEDDEEYDASQCKKLVKKVKKFDPMPYYDGGYSQTLSNCIMILL